MGTNIERPLNELLTFTYEIAKYVSAHSAWRARWLGGPWASMSFEGDIPIDKAIARLSFSSRPDWLSHAPVVRCNAPWMRRGEADWHVASDGSLCWVFEPYWRDVLKESAGYLDEKELRQMAAYWCASAAADLVGKHLFADTHGIKAWPKEWEFWAHGPEEAGAQLKNMKATGEFWRSASELRKKAKAAKALAAGKQFGVSLTACLD
jgi:hypothetical protein